MDIDATTASDLEIFDSHDSRGGLFQLIDDTTTTAGSRALRRRVTNPSSDPSEIRRVQEAVRFLQSHSDAIWLQETAMDSVGRYLRSNIDLSDAGPILARVEYAWMTVRYRDLVRELIEGVQATVSLFIRVARMCKSLEALDPPEELKDILDALGAVATAVLAVSAERSHVLRADWTFRTDLRDDIERALELLGELDALDTMARVTTTRGWTMPEFADARGFTLEVEGLFHPFVEDPVTNPVRLTGGEPLLFLTGPNMAGKTTYLRSVAIVVLLAHLGMGVPATSARLTAVDALFVSLNPADDLRAGLSYFMAEVLRVKAAATMLAQGMRALVIFDEVFKGTNVRDALDASAQVILGFARARHSGCIFSSHLTELVAALEDNPAIRYFCFDGDIVAGAPHYAYRLREGISDTRFGLLLLEQAEVPELLSRIG